MPGQGLSKPKLTSTSKMWENVTKYKKNVPFTVQKKCVYPCFPQLVIKIGTFYRNPIPIPN